METIFESTINSVGAGKSTVEQELELARLRARENNVRIMTYPEFLRAFVLGDEIPVDAEGLTVSHFANQFTINEWEDDPLPILVATVDHHDFHKAECLEKLAAMITLCVNWNKKFAS